MMAPALARTIAALYAPKRDVAGGETIDAWLKRYTDYMVKMGLASYETAPAVQDVVDSVDKLSGPAQRAPAGGTASPLEESAASSAERAAGSAECAASRAAEPAA